MRARHCWRFRKISVKTTDGCFRLGECRSISSGVTANVDRASMMRKMRATSPADLINMAAKLGCRRKPEGPYQAKDF
jgi:hypothetical protein